MNRIAVWRGLTIAIATIAVISLFKGMAISLEEMQPSGEVILDGYKEENKEVEVRSDQEAVSDTLSSPQESSLENVKISGEVIFDGYIGGNIGVRVRQDKDIFSSITLSRPGSFFLSVPKNKGKVYIEAGGIPEDDYLFSQHDAQIQKVINVSDSDINDVKLSFENDGLLEIPAPGTKMEEYVGDTVTISGKIIVEDYEKGMVCIGAWSDQPVGRPDLAMVIISQPGPYSFKVPMNQGNINVGVLVTDRGMHRN